MVKMQRTSIMAALALILLSLAQKTHAAGSLHVWSPTELQDLFDDDSHKEEDGLYGTFFIIYDSLLLFYKMTSFIGGFY